MIDGWASVKMWQGVLSASGIETLSLPKQSCACKVAPTRDMQSSEDAVQVAAAQTGDRSAFALLYDRFAPLVHGILLSHVPALEVDDLVHDVFLAALRGLPGLREPAAFGAWLVKIARNRAKDFHRRGPRHTEADLLESLAGTG